MAGLKYLNKNGNWVVINFGGLSSVNWNSITNKPSTFPPSTHQHKMSDIIGLQELINLLNNKIQDLQNLIDNLVPSNISITLLVSPKTIIEGTNTQITLMAKVTDTVGKIALRKNGVLLSESTDGVNSYTYKDTINRSTQYSAEITVKGKTYRADANVTAQPKPVEKDYMYLGAGLNYTDIIKEENKKIVIMNQEFDALLQVKQTGDIPFIAIPAKINSMTCMLGPLPFALSEPVILEIQGKSYKVYQSNPMKLFDFNLKITLR